MKISLDLSSPGARVLALIAALGLFCGGVGFALARFITAVAASPRLPVDLSMIEATAAYFPDSAAVHARLAARLVEGGTESAQSHEALAARALYHASRAVKLAPANYEYHVLLSAAAELRGDGEAAEAALREALRLAPNNVNPRWQMANLLLRLGKLEESLGEFRAVADADPSRLPNTLGLLWQATAGNVETLHRVAGGGPGARLTLAHFLVEQARFDAAAGIFRGVDRNSRLRAPESGQSGQSERILDALLKAGQWEWAGKLWRATLEHDEQSEPALLWNGGFESPIRKGLAQFDWNLGAGNYARFGITTGHARGGRHALRLTYLGLETTRLDGEAQQLILVRPGASYRLECFARADGLTATDGPQVAVLRPDTRAVVAASSAVTPGTHDWEPLVVDFIAPAGAPVVLVTIKQTPRYSFVEPTQGIVWFDDFSLKMQ